VVELCQSFLGDREGGSGLSVLRTFRLLRILKLVRFMPNLRRQLFVMLRTMDNVAVFFALLILFIFIFRYVSARKTPLTSAPKHTQLVSLDPFDTLQPPNERVLLLPSETQNSPTTATFLFFTPHIYPLV
jgi:Ion transport protein